MLCCVVLCCYTVLCHGMLLSTCTIFPPFMQVSMRARIPALFDVCGYTFSISKSSFTR